MKIERIQKRVALAAALLACAASSVFAQADQKTQEKIRLMVTAVQARDNGDLQASKQALEELLKIAPEDAGVKRMMSDVNSDIERQNKGEVTVLVNPEVAEKVAQQKAEEKAAEEAAAAETKAAEEEKVAEEKAAEEEKVAEAKAAEEEKAAEVAAAEQAAVDSTVADAVRKVQIQIMSAYDLIDEAYNAMDEGRWDEANAALDAATAKLPANEYAPMADDTRAEIKRARAVMAKERATIAMGERNMPEAKTFAKTYAENEASKDKGDDFVAKVAKFDDNPYNHKLDDVDSEYAIRQQKVNVFIQKGQRQYLYGDYQGARSSFRQVEALDADNIVAKAYQKLISQKLDTNAKLTYESTRAGLLDQVGRAWQLPQVYTGQTINQGEGGKASATEAKLNSIVIPEVNYPNAKFAEVIKTLGDVSVFYDKSADGKKGVNIVLFADDADAQKPININLREVSLGKVLGWVTKQAGYSYDVEDETIVVRKASGDVVVTLETQDFPISDTAVTKMIGMKAPTGGGDSGNPFGDAGGTSGASPENKEELIKNFLVKTGVDFAQGANIAYDGTKLWVTNTTRNLEKIRRILLRYNEVKQIEIEAKFMEVNQGDLKELNFNWSVKNGSQMLFQSNNRNLVQSISTSGTGKSTWIYNAAYTPTDSQGNRTGATVPATSQEVSNTWPVIPSTLNLGEINNGMVNAVIGAFNGYDVSLMIDALEQKQGSDLLCSPKVTVTSGNTASITVSQQIRYPENWGDMQSNVGTSSGTNSGGAAGVTITPGTPQDFVSKDVGVVMEVTPNVLEDGSTIEMTLNPAVTEFEGWMEYGGTAVAISGITTVTIPSGFIQPVFAVREIRTNITVFDGATVVMGGLTREEIKSVDDQVPVLGDIPYLGRLFQSKGESRQKKNLLIFITANRISPGGSVVREQFQEMRPGSVFQNPIIVSPGGAVQRVLEDDTTAKE